MSRENENRHVEYPEDVDLREAYGGKFINAQSAEGANVHVIRAKEFTLPVSFDVEAGRFRLSGKTAENNWGIISGVLVENKVLVNHVDVANEVRNLGIGSALVSDLEDQLKQSGVEIVYAAFANTKTVDFFEKKGYKKFDINLLPEQTKKQFLIDEDDFDITAHPDGAKILLSKEITRT